jgi:predicted RNase H-like HicB family nuclease
MSDFTFDYWKDGDWFVGRLNEKPNVISQGRTVEELQSNIRDAFELVRKFDETENLAQAEDEGYSPLPLQEFLHELRDAGCLLKIHEGAHDLYMNQQTGRAAPVPRHALICQTLARAIRKQLRIL